MIDRLTRFNLVCRALCLWASLTTLLQAWGSPQSLPAMVIEAGGNLGLLMLLLMSLAVGAGVLDVFVSDVLPARFTVDWLARNRHLGYMALSACHFVQAIPAATLHHVGAGALTLHFMGMGCLCAWFAWSLVMRSEERGRPYAA